MIGKPMPDCGKGGTSVPSLSFGTCESGGATPSVDHWSRSVHKARWTGAESSGFWNCWHKPLEAGLPAPPCCLLDSRYNRVSGWSGRSNFPVGSVLMSDPAFTQYSLAEKNSVASGQVLLCSHR